MLGDVGKMKQTNLKEYIQELSIRESVAVARTVFLWLTKSASMHCLNIQGNFSVFLIKTSIVNLHLIYLNGRKHYKYSYKVMLEYFWILPLAVLLAV